MQNRVGMKKRHWANDNVYIKKLKICANAKTKAQNGNCRRHMFSLEFQMLSPLYDGVSVKDLGTEITFLFHKT